MSVMVEVRDLRKSFKTANGTYEAVKGINLQVKRGEIYSLLGPNGAGKTTTISMMSGLLLPNGGDASVGGYSITKQAIQAKSLLGVVPQQIALYPTLTARQNLEFFGKMYGMGGATLAKRVDEVLEFTDLADRQRDKVETFSGGMQRRVNIGVGLLHNPQLIFMDEPTVGVDPQNRRRLLDTVMRMRDEMQMTVLYTSHLMEEVQEISDRVGIMDHGEIIAEGNVGELIQHVGEEDRLILRVGDQKIRESTLVQMRTTVDGVTSVSHEAPQAADANGDTAPSEDGYLLIHARRGRKALPDLLRIINEAALDVHSVEIREPDLEAVFLHLTGRALRD